MPDGYKMISNDVKSLFTNVPSGGTLEIILKKVKKQEGNQNFYSEKHI